LLADGIKVMLHNPTTGLATEVYLNPLVHPRNPTSASGTLDEEVPLDDAARESAAFGGSLPSYVDPTNFANALLAALALDQGKLDAMSAELRRPASDGAPAGPEAIKDWIRRNIAALQRDAQLRALLADSIYRNGANIQAIRTATARWFEQSTDRISGSFKRRTQLTSFLIALAMAVIFDLSPLPPSIAVMLQANPAAAVVAVTANGATAAKPATAAIGGGPAVVQNGTPPAGGGGGRPAWAAAVRVFGWLSIALSTLLGAPFWFGILSKVTNVRGTGAAADEKDSKAAPAAQATVTAPPGGSATATAEPSPGSPPAAGGGAAPTA
jgi:hypothetical protein